MPTWLITGCSSGFSLEVAKPAVAQGDKVIATSRNVLNLTELANLGALTMSRDITASDAVVEKIVVHAMDTYRFIDILLNNAGYISEGGVEEARYSVPHP